jgi:hypothetical protein
VYQGLTIDVETRKGRVRSGTDDKGKAWSVRMPAHYGEIRGTRGADGDAVDVFIGPDPYAPWVYVIQTKLPGSKAFDEVKAMLGFATRTAALQAFRSAYKGGGFYLGSSRWPIGAFKEAMTRPHLARGRLRVPLRKGRMVVLVKGDQLGLFTQVKPHSRKGRPVRGHQRQVERAAPTEPVVPLPAIAKQQRKIGPKGYIIGKPYRWVYDTKMQAEAVAKDALEKHVPPGSIVQTFGSDSEYTVKNWARGRVGQAGRDGYIAAVLVNTSGGDVWCNVHDISAVVSKPPGEAIEAVERLEREVERRLESLAAGESEQGWFGTPMAFEQIAGKMREQGQRYIAAMGEDFPELKQRVTAALARLHNVHPATPVPALKVGKVYKTKRGGELKIIEVRGLRHDPGLYYLVEERGQRYDQFEHALSRKVVLTDAEQAQYDSNLADYKARENVQKPGRAT